MKSLTNYISENMEFSKISLNESSSGISIEDIKKFIQMEKDLGFKIEGIVLDNIVDVYLSHYDINDVCKALNISTSNSDTEFSIKQKIKTEFKKLS